MKIKITGDDIIGWDHHDPTGALKELGVEYKPWGLPKNNIAEVKAMEFEVDMDFILRHDLLDYKTYSYYQKTEIYKKYYDEGWNAFKADGPLYARCPYDLEKNKLHEKVYPWLEGFRSVQWEFFQNKYRLDQFREELQALFSKYGLQLCESDEYSPSRIRTPEGYECSLTP